MSKSNPPKSYQDLMRVTGLGRDTVKAAIRSGELPGYLVGRSYIVPADAFDAFCRGEWTPKPRPVLSQPATPKYPIEFIRQKEKVS